MSAPEMVLQYVNTLRWPVIVGFAVLAFKAPFAGLIERIQSARLEGPGISAEIEARAIDAAEEIEVTPNVQLESRETEESELSGTGTVTPIIRVPPLVYAAYQYGKHQRERLQLKLDRLREFSVSGASTLRTISRDPAGAISTIWGDLIAILGNVNYAYGDQLWPGTPPNLVNGYEELNRLRKRVASNDDVTESAAYAYNGTARLWAREYAAALGGAIIAAQDIADGVRVLPEGPSELQ